MKIAGILAIALGLIFSGIYLNERWEDSNKLAGNIAHGFDLVHDGSRREFADFMKESDARKQAENTEGLGGLVAIIAGIALIGKANTDQKRLDLLLSED